MYLMVVSLRFVIDNLEVILTDKIQCSSLDTNDRSWRSLWALNPPVKIKMAPHIFNNAQRNP